MKNMIVTKYQGACALSRTDTAANAMSIVAPRDALLEFHKLFIYKVFGFADDG